MLSNKLFNSLYVLILVYGSDVWSIYDKDDYNSWEKDTIKNQLYFCKQVLVVKINSVKMQMLTNMTKTRKVLKKR